MSLRNFQTEIELDTLYKIQKKASPSGVYETLNPNIYIDSGSVDVYVSNSATQPTATGDMVLDDANSEISGCRGFQVLPTYIYITQNTGATIEMVLTGVSVEDLGGF